MSTLERPVGGQRVRPRSTARRRKIVGSLGPWELLSTLGEGALTRVYLARPEQANDEAEPAYVVKLLRRQWHDCPAAIDVLRREWHVGRSVSSCHVVPMLSAHLDEPPYYVVQPRLAGVTLDDCMGEGYRPSLAVCLWFARQAAEGLSTIHASCGMTHGDVKPSNIVISPSGHVTLIDLGFARSEQEERAWATRPVLGTPYYVAPEAITSALATDVRSDIYSLGVTLYESLCGQRPFDAGDAATLATLHRSHRPVCLRKQAPDVPKPVASLVHTMISKEPLRRPQGYEELIGELQQLEIRYFADREIRLSPERAAAMSIISTQPCIHPPAGEQLV